MVKCKICGEEIKEGHELYSDKLDATLCEYCFDAEKDYPQGTVIVFYPKEGTVDKFIIYSVEDVHLSQSISSLDEYDDLNFDILMEENSPIQFKWVSTDPWRGYYEPVAGEWVKIHEDAILHGSKDAEYLGRFYENLKKILWEAKIDFAIVFGTTSNVFSTGFDILVKKEDFESVVELMKLYFRVLELKEKYRDTKRFILTAITGKNDFDETDDKLYAILKAHALV
ncbi:hypothetical protein DRP07_02250 [Archaeoglobales archaeon]|nr:MAG: hypothetical protein DRP07_02250 [Archaeoglobales archaeon]